MSRTVSSWDDCTDVRSLPTQMPACRYLGSIGLKVALFGGVLVAFLVLSRRSKEKADKRASELFMQEELSRTGAGPGPVSGAESGGPDESVPRRERRWQVGDRALLPQSSWSSMMAA